MTPNRKKELKKQYEEIKIDAGVYQIRNTINGKVLIMKTPNLKTINGKLFMLKNGSIYNEAIQKDLIEFGSEAFVIEILEVLEEKEDLHWDKKDALKKLEEKWISKIQPFGEQGYN